MDANVQNRLVLSTVNVLRDQSNTKRGRTDKGVHVVYGGVNEALKALGIDDPRAATKQAEDAGLVVTHGARGGAMIYPAGDAPERASRISAATLDAIKAKAMHATKVQAKK